MILTKIRTIIIFKGSLFGIHIKVESTPQKEIDQNKYVIYFIRLISKKIARLYQHRWRTIYLHACLKQMCRFETTSNIQACFENSGKCKTYSDLTYTLVLFKKTQNVV